MVIGVWGRVELECNRMKELQKQTGGQGAWVSRLGDDRLRVSCGEQVFLERPHDIQRPLGQSDDRRSYMTTTTSGRLVLRSPGILGILVSLFITAVGQPE
jgi:hypothetical protein